MELKTYSMSSIGGRKTNDDTAIVARQGENAWLFVGDGLGAYAGGKQASRAAGQALVEMCRRGSMLSRERMAQGAEAADNAVKAVQQQTAGTMKTTLVFLAVEGVRRRPIDPDKEGMVHGIGFLLLLGLIVVITYQDIARMFFGG